MQAFCTVHNRNDAPKSHCCQTNSKFMCACSQWISAQRPCPYTLFAQWTETAFICTNKHTRRTYSEQRTHLKLLRMHLFRWKGAQRSERVRKSSDSKNSTINTNSWSVNTHTYIRFVLVIIVKSKRIFAFQYATFPSSFDSTKRISSYKSQKGNINHGKIWHENNK